MSAPAAARARRHAFSALTVAAVERLTDDSAAVTLDVPADLTDAYAYEAGQHLTVRVPQLGDDVRRNYSICNPAGAAQLRIGVKRLPEGAFSGYVLDRLRPGDSLDVMPPSGRFTVPLDPGNAKHYCAIAAGSGISPVLSILWTVLETEPASRCTLIYGNRSSASIMFLEDLEDLKNRFPGRLQLVHVLSRERQDAALLNGRIDAGSLPGLLDTFAPPDDVDEWLLCGPAEMIETARAVLHVRGVAPATVHRELFHTGPEAPRPRRAEVAADARAAEVTVVLDGRSFVVRVPPDGDPILDAVLRVRADAPYACKNGMCGTCRAKVVEGSVEMDHNYALEDSEQAAGFVLACQSHPTSPTVTLDFDA